MRKPLFLLNLLTGYVPSRSGVSVERRRLRGVKQAAALCRDAATERWFTRRVPELLLLAFVSASSATARAESWPCWRGPRGDGTCLEQNIPTNWNPTGAVWKTEIPGQGHASPIVWGERICLATALPDKQERLLLCLDRASGKTLWRQTVVTGPLEKIHRENSYASGAPATDGERVFVTFRVGDEIVVAAHDLRSGRQLWLVRPGTHAGEWGFSNEPVLHQDKVIVDGDGKGDSFLVALSRTDGKTIWRIKRTHRGISYSAPLIREVAGRTQLIQCGDRCVTAFDPANGQPFWSVDGPSEEFVATPVYSEKAGLVFISSSWPKTVLLAIRPDGRGDVTQTHVAWRDAKGAPYVPSMMLAGDYLLTVNGVGVAYCYEAATGTVLWQEKLGRHHASPVLVGGLVYLINDAGEINVIKPGRTFERVARFDLGEQCYASPALSDGQVFLRGFQHLFCFGQGAAK
jgi:outer membrane protein assembly factor BamB